ncbi:nuclear transport factor 2 family protein [Salipiger bermudensis]|uniref:nuclear transport factor 2 family protein n=1 Tax=Salipiger bermudensis TaxID=344736 RepID=UPI001A8EF75A|nr:nuclear transport factor 2 family protein [Salipiger bermudensis]MBN9677800.1 nuclear transport factor 2 family protein [Salipiger bermudensis]MCA1287746.1 nuclear transport factor 2 family protein [Salipiger bermudensis]
MSTTLSIDPETLGPEARIVHDYLEASMVPDPERAATYMADDVVITFTGGRVYHHPSGPAGFNAMRYAWVKKDMRQFDVAQGAEGTVVYSTGYLYGEWHDGTAFEGNRYVDRFVVENGKIVKMDVWNDSAERILSARGIEA